MAELADHVLLSRSGMTRLVDRLEREGLLERKACPSDRRGCLAVLTEAGDAMLAGARPTHLDGVRERFLRHFDESELRPDGGVLGSRPARGRGARPATHRSQS